MCPRVLFSPGLLPPHPLSPSLLRGSRVCCHVPQSADQYVPWFSSLLSLSPSLSLSLSEEKTQLVLNVDKQLEEVRELVRL